MGAGRQRLLVFLDGVPWCASLADSVWPLRPAVEDVAPWSSLAASKGPEALLNWLSLRSSQRPLLGLTSSPLYDAGRVPLRGLSRSGKGVALASAHGLSPEDLAGVVRHEMAHALGLPHCDAWSCALSPRPFPLPVSDRAAGLCPACEARWRAAVEKGAA
ncbi:MAG: hypothetical protein ACOYXN_08625 [Acidobacteriota bacterium]